MDQVNPILLGVIAGVAGTLVMDMANHFLSRAGLLVKIDMRALGRMSAGWLHGRFRYGHPDEMHAVRHEWSIGYLTHHAISILFALTYVLGWLVLFGEPVSVVWALAFGIATTAASQLLVFPAMGFGVFARKAPEGLRARLSSLLNHVFFGLGMASAIALF